MSVIAGDGKADALITWLFNDETSFPEQCALEREIISALAVTMENLKKEGKVKHFQILDDSLINEKLVK